MPKQELFKMIHDGLHAIGGKQSDIAERLGISKTDVTRMMRPGAESGMSFDKGMAVLGAMGVRVTLNYERCEPFSTPGRYGSKVQERLEEKAAQSREWESGFEDPC